MEIAPIVRAFIVDELLHAGPGVSFEADDPLIRTGILDSLALLKLLLFLEERFGVKVNDREVVPDNFDTLNRIVGFVERKRPRPDAILPSQEGGAAKV